MKELLGVLLFLVLVGLFWWGFNFYAVHVQPYFRRRRR